MPLNYVKSLKSAVKIWALGPILHPWIPHLGLHEFYIEQSNMQKALHIDWQR